MNYCRTTHVPNSLFDVHLPSLGEAELKVLLVIIRHTNGWVNRKTGRRRTYAWITYKRFMNCSGLSRRVMTSTVKSLLAKGLITISTRENIPLDEPRKRNGRTRLYYSLRLDNPVSLKENHMREEIRSLRDQLQHEMKIAA